MKNPFSEQSLAVFPQKYFKDKNISVLFKVDFLKQEKATLVLAGEIEYQVFLNGELISYGPAKAAHNYHRIDEIKLKNLLENNRLIIIIASYRVNNFDRVNEPPFVRFELKGEKELIAASNLNSEAFLYNVRYQKVTRLSYQRAFSESYNNGFNNKIFYFGTPISLPKVELSECGYGKFLKRNVLFPKLKTIKASLKEKDDVFINNSKNVYSDRYMFNEGIGIYKVNEWEKDPNKVVSLFDYNKKDFLNNHICANQSLAYVFPHSETGFVKLKLKVLKPCDLYVYFEEINFGKGIIDFDFYRNTMHNIISYELDEGEYELVSFQPYTVRFLRTTLLSGEIEIENVSIVVLENPESYKLKYKFDNKKIKTIFDAARRTFASNAVDILTDCPSRERAGWLCDGLFTGRAEKLFTGRNRVERNFLENYSHYSYHGDVEKGMLPMCYPADFFNNEQYIPNWAMFYVVELESYLSRNDDKKLKKESLRNIKSLLRFFEKYENEYGLLENLESWIMVEWSHANDPESIQGVNIPSNALYVGFLKSAGIILGNDSLIEKANKVKKTIKSMAFTGNFFVDNLIRDIENKLVQNNRICETTLYYLFYFDVITKDEYPKVFEKMVNDFGPNRDTEKVYPNIYKANVFIGDYLRLEILLRDGLASKVLDETIEFFYKMAKTTGTLWEHDSVHGSLNHGFASYSANLIFKAITGVYKIDFINRIIYMRKSIPNMEYKFVVPLKKGKLIFSNLGNVIPEEYKVRMED